MKPEVNQTLLQNLEGLISVENDETQKSFLTSIKDHLSALAEENEQLEIQSLQSTLWALNLQAHAKTIHTIGEAFSKKVTNTTWKTSEPRVVGYKREFEMLRKSLESKMPEMPTAEHVKAMIEKSQKVKDEQAKKDSLTNEPAAVQS